MMSCPDPAGRRQEGKHPLRTYRFSLRLVEERHGQGNFDDAGDAMVTALWDIAGRDERHVVGFEFDIGHANPWFHALVFSVAGLSEQLHRRLLDRLAAIGLPPDA